MSEKKRDPESEKRRRKKIKTKKKKMSELNKEQQLSQAEAE